MLLAIDIGNTNIVIALHDGKTWFEQKRVKTKDWEATKKIEAIISQYHWDSSVLSCVVPRLTMPVANLITEIGGKAPVIVGININSGLVKESIPPELGSDILCNLIAAHAKYPDKYVTVADFGTAFTTETVDPEGNVLGVTIGPGMMTSVKALFENTAQIPQIRLDIPTTALGRTTVDSIKAGVIYGFTGQLAAIKSQIEKEIGHKVYLIATGGFSKYLTGYAHVDETNIFHTLEGCRLACLMNS